MKTKKVIVTIATVLITLTIFGLIASLFVKLDRQTSTTTIGSESYSIGTLDESGKFVEGDTAIYMRKAITTDGLKVELADNAEITYQIFFYDEKDQFISATDALSEDFTGAIPENAKSAKIMITPTADADGKVTFFEISGYANQLTVTVKK